MIDTTSTAVQSVTRVARAVVTGLRDGQNASRVARAIVTSLPPGVNTSRIARGIVVGPPIDYISTTRVALAVVVQKPDSGPVETKRRHCFFA